MIIKNIFELYRKIFSSELFYFDVVYTKPLLFSIQNYLDISNNGFQKLYRFFWYHVFLELPFRNKISIILLGMWRWIAGTFTRIFLGEEDHHAEKLFSGWRNLIYLYSPQTFVFTRGSTDPSNPTSGYVPGGLVWVRVRNEYNTFTHLHTHQPWKP